MSKPRRIESYPATLFELVLRFEEGNGAEYTVHGLRVGVASAIRAELYGLRKALEHAGRAHEFPNFMSARLYLKPDALVLVSADQLGYAKELGTILNNG